MTSRIPVIACSAAAFVLLAGGLTRLSAQSLADVARQEEERRKEVKAPAKVYTNKDLRSVPPPSTPTPSPAPATDAATPGTPAAGAADKPAAAGGAAGAVPGKEVVKDQAYWSKRMGDLRTALERDQTYADAMQVKINSLNADFVARDDPAQRAAVAAERTKTLADFERLKTAIQNNKKAIADLEDEARRASVPAGWLR